MDLVDRAYNNDPRIRAERAREQAAKDAAKLPKNWKNKKSKKRKLDKKRQRWQKLPNFKRRSK
jgi:hypothetical protein